MSALARASAAWGNPLPEWVRALAGECDDTSLRKVAAKLDVSPASVSLAIGRKRGSFDFIKARVKSTLMVTTVACPVLGILDINRCLQEQARPFPSANPFRVQLFRACRNGCKYYRGTSNKEHRHVEQED